MATGLPDIKLRAVTSPPTGVSDGGNRAVASAFAGISRDAMAISARIRESEARTGAEQALKAYNEAAAKTPAGEMVATPEREGGLLDFLGVADESYENTVKALSLQRAEKDANEQLRQMRVDTFGKPSEFEDKAEAYIAGYMSDAPAESANEIELIMRGRAQSLMSDALIERRKLDMDEDRQGTNAQIASREQDIREIADKYGLGAFEREDFQRAIVEIEDLLNRKANDPSHVYSEEQHDRDYSSFLDGLQFVAASATVQDEVREALDYQGLDGAKETLDDFFNSEVGQGFDRATQERLRLAGEKLVREREIEINAETAEAKKRRSEFQSGHYTEYALRIADRADVPTRQELQDAYDQGNLNGGQLLSLVQQVNKRDKKQEALDAAYDLIAGDTPLNPGNADHRKAVDSVFEAAGGKDLMQEDFAAGTDLALGFAASKGVVPASAASSIKALVYGGSTEQTGAALDAIARIYEQAPGAATQAFKNAELAEAIHYRELAANGAPAELAVGAVVEGRKAKYDPALKERISEGEDIAVEEITPETTLKVVGADVEDSIGLIDIVTLGVGEFLDAPDLAGGEAAAQAANRVHRQLFAAEYQKHGNADIALKQANALLKRTYGKSTATGSARIMQYPPEQFYSVPGVNNRWMRKQFDETTADLGDGTFGLVADTRTAADVQSGALPSYKIIRKRTDGVLEAVDGRFIFDPAASLAEAEQNIEDELRSARLLRAARGDIEPRDIDRFKSVR